MIITYGCVAMLALSSAMGAQAPHRDASSPRTKVRGTTARAKRPPLKTPKAQPAQFAKPTPKRAAKVDPLAEVLAKVQKYYAQIEDYRADFIQTYTRVALSRTTEQRGVLMLKKPGSMRWSYTHPVEKLWVVDGDTLYVVDPEFEQVFVDKHFKTDELQSSISFLWGRGRLDKSFQATLGGDKDYKAPTGHHVLVLKPKAGATYHKLILVVHAVTGAVTESIIYGTAGNTNHFKFTNPKHNTKLKASLFKYTPPENFEVIHR